LGFGGGKGKTSLGGGKRRRITLNQDRLRRALRNALRAAHVGKVKSQLAAEVNAQNRGGELKEERGHHQEKMPPKGKKSRSVNSMIQRGKKGKACNSNRG